MPEHPDAATFVAEGIVAARDSLAAAAAPHLVADVAAAADLVVDVLRGGGCLHILGNGGSAADAAHLAAEFVGRCTRDRGALPAIALAEQSATMTALANDFGYEEVFARQIRGLARPGDLVVALSTSGRSPNVLAALDAVGEVPCRSLGMTGPDGGGMSGRCDVLLRAPAVSTPRIQELHQVWGHLLAEWAERALFP